MPSVFRARWRTTKTTKRSEMDDPKRRIARRANSDQQSKGAVGKLARAKITLPSIKLADLPDDL